MKDLLLLLCKSELVILADTMFQLLLSVHVSI